MLQQEGPPEDFVIATGRQESVRRFIELAAAELGWGSGGHPPIQWQGEGLEEVGRRADTGAVVVRIDPSTSARRRWKPCWGIRARPATGLARHL